MKRLTENVRKLTPEQTRRLKSLLAKKPRQSEIEAFVDSCLAEETKSTSISRRIQNSQLRAALSLMDWSTWSGTYGMH